MDSIEAEIADRLEEIPLKAQIEGWQKSERPWTRAVKQVVVDVGKRHGWRTAANGCDSDDQAEWLYDVVWYQLDQSGCLTDVYLVAESEWGDERAIKDDFQKLLVSRSPYHVMICQTDNDDKATLLIQQMRDWIAKYQRSVLAGHFLFAVWAKDHWVIKHHRTETTLVL